jgi:hypothetical protein
MRIDRIPVLVLAIGMYAFVRSLACGLILAAAPAVSQTNTVTNSILPGGHWPIGEKLTYRLYWGYIPVGTAIGWTEWTEHKGRPVLAIRMRTISNKFVEKLYPVNDIIESLVDPETFLPLQFTKNLSEGSHRYHEVTTFDHPNLVAHWESKRDGKKRDFKLTPDVRDIPSLMFYLRTRTFVPGTREHFTVMADDKTYDLWLNVLKKESIDLPLYGEVPSIKAEPEAAFEGLFVRRGKLWIWISDDERRLATRVVGSVPVATVRAILWKVEGPGTDSWITNLPPEERSETNTPPAPQP